jgi:hypothetical protein
MSLPTADASRWPCRNSKYVGIANEENRHFNVCCLL